MGLIVICVLWAAAVFLYFAPALVASQRGHPSKTSILVVNLFLGWLLIPWVICLAWALGRIEGESDQPAERVCPLCAEDIRAEAIKCKHCGSALPSTAMRGN